jgi:hypothetical protein
MSGVKKRMKYVKYLTLTLSSRRGNTPLLPGEKGLGDEAFSPKKGLGGEVFSPLKGLGDEAF